MSGGLFATAGTKLGKGLNIGTNVLDPYEPVSDAFADITSKGVRKAFKKPKVTPFASTFTSTKSFTTTKTQTKPTDALGDSFKRVKVKTISEPFGFVTSKTKSDPFANVGTKPFVPSKTRTEARPIVNPDPFVSTVVKTDTKVPVTIKPLVTAKTQVTAKTKVRDELFALAGAGMFMGGFGLSRYKRKTGIRSEVKTKKIADLFSKSFGKRTNDFNVFSAKPIKRKKSKSFGGLLN